MTGRRVRADTAGVATVEFAMIAPVLLIFMFGIFDLGYNMYASSMLQGAVQQAARKSTLEGAETQGAQLDAIVTTAVHSISPHATLKFDRTAYANFSDIGRPEDYTDINNNNTCDAGEPFEDANSNKMWDADRGSAGFGGARDAVLYSVTVSYRRLFPIARLIPGQTDTFTVTTKTVLRNQPYALGEGPSSATGNCT